MRVRKILVILSAIIAISHIQVHATGDGIRALAHLSTARKEIAASAAYAHFSRYAAARDIPNRRLTDEELDAWKTAYHFFGGVNENEWDLIHYTNLVREQYGLPPFEYDPTLMMAARFKAQSMSQLQYFAHESPVYGTWYIIPRELFGSTSSFLAENLARRQRSPQEAVDALMNSPGHRDNILRDNVTRMGAGFYNYHWVQFFSN